ncbi:MAG: amino acid permease [Hyphomonas sp.]|nr:amino acid permease [Hyphomonas sp.]
MSADAKQIGPFLAMAIVAGNMIGSGVFLLPAVLATVGSASLIAWGVAAVIAVALALVFAFLGSVRDGSETLTDYPGTAFHPALGFVAWAAYWAACFIGNVAIAIVAVGYGAAIFGVVLDATQRFFAILATIWVLVGCALAGPRFVGRMSSATLAIGLAPIAAAIVIGFYGFDADLFAASWNVSGAPLGDALPPTLLSIFWAFLGLESANAIASRVRHPRRNIAVAAAGGVAIAAVVYALATTALFGLVPAAQLAASTAPFADVIGSVAGPAAGVLVACAAFARTIGCTAGWIYVGGETGQAGGRRGFLPKQFSSTAPGAAPVRDLLVMGALMSLVAFLTLTPDLVAQFSLIADITVYVFLLIYALSAAAVVKFAGDIEHAGLRWAARSIGAFAAAASIWVAWAAAAG